MTLSGNLGYDYWNVIVVNGQFSRKTYASGNYFVVFERFDGMQVIIWLNKLVIIILFYYRATKTSC
jgi:hypothetical protein